MQKRVLIIVTKGDLGGAQQSVFNLAKELNRRGADVTVACGSGDFLPKKLAGENIPFFRFTSLRRTMNIFSGLCFFSEFKEFLKKNNFEVIHFNSSNTLVGAWAAKLLNKDIKTVFTFRGLSYLDKNYTRSRLKSWFFLFIFKILLKKIDQQVYVSKTNEDYAKKLKLAKNSITVHNGLPNLLFLEKTEAVKILEEKTSLKLSNKFIIGSVGRLSFQKNYEFLINSAHKILDIKPETKIIIIGDGPEEKKYRKLIIDSDLGDAVVIITNLGEAYKYLKAFDIFLLPSRYEGMSITLIEALQAGLPILASDVGGACEMLGEKSLFRLDDEESFLQKLQLLITNTGEREQNGQDNNLHSVAFKINKTAEEYLKIY